MKNCLITIFVFTIFIGFQSCDPWEDESYHPGGPGGNGNTPALLLKEIKTTHLSGMNSLSTYSYDSESRISMVKSFPDVADTESYSLLTYQYPSDSQVIINAKTYQLGDLFATMNTTININGNTVQMEIENNLTGNISTTLTLESPCGVQKAIMSMEILGQPVESINTYEYFDANCSYKHKIDGNLNETIYKDDKNFPLVDPQTNFMGIEAHNDIKIENANGEIETITYTYNDLDFPTKAIHSFSGASSQEGFTEEFIYFE